MKTRQAARTTLLFSASLVLLAACQTPGDPSLVPIPAALPAPVDATKGANCIQVASFTEEGIASWYGRAKKPRRTASGEVQDGSSATAAHPTLPFGSQVTVTNLANGHSTIVRINDRGPFKKGRILDVSQKSARDLDFIRDGVTRVKIEMGPKVPRC